MSRKSARRVCRTGNVICTGKPAAGKSFLLYDTLIAKGLVQAISLPACTRARGQNNV